jgi:peroxiredoxin
MRIKLETLTNVAVLILCVVMIGVVVHGWFVSRRAVPKVAAHSDSGYRAGERLEALPGVDLKGAKRTLILFLKTTCQFCSKSTPFYKELGQLARNRSGQIRLVAMGPDAEADLRAFLEAHGVAIDTVVSVSLTRTRVPGTPTLVLIDDRGVVLNQWVGLLAPEQQEQVISTLSRATASE